MPVTGDLQVVASPLGDFVKSAGFAGAAALVAALILMCTMLVTSRRAGRRFDREIEQRERHHEKAREDAQHAAQVQRGWERLKWVLETTGTDSVASDGVTLGLGPELVFELLRGLLSDAERLGDDALIRAVTMYHKQFGLVLAQHGGTLAELAAATSAVDGKPDKKSSPETDEEPTAKAVVTAGGRRRR